MVCCCTLKIKFFSHVVTFTLCFNIILDLISLVDAVNHDIVTLCVCQVGINDPAFALIIILLDGQWQTCRVLRGPVLSPLLFLIIKIIAWFLFHEHELFLLYLYISALFSTFQISCLVQIHINIFYENCMKMSYKKI